MNTAMKCILLVDDEPGLRQLLITTLAAPELTIAQAGSGETDGAVGGAVVEADLVAGLVVDEATGKDGVGDVARSLVVR